MNKKKKPCIRFKGFTDDWEQRKVGEFLTVSKIPGHTGIDAKKLTVKLWGKGIIGKNDVFTGSENTKYYIRRAGQFMYGKLDFLHAAFGIVPEHLDTYESTLDSPAFDMHDIDSHFLLERVMQKNFYLHNGIIANGSRKAKRIHENIFLDMNLVVPSYIEQEKIGSIFRSLDDLITLHQRKCEKLKIIKKSMLENCFPKNGQKVPKIRFSGFTGDWEQRKLGDIVQITMGQSPNGETYSEKPSDYILVQGMADLKVGWVFPRVWTTQKTKTCDAGDLIMSVRAPAGAVGKTAYSAVIGRGVSAIKGNEFIYQTLTKRYLDGCWKKIAAGSTFESINFSAIADAEIMLPSGQEQKRIGRFFSNLDYLITLHQSKLEKLQKIKKSMLERMFV